MLFLLLFFFQLATTSDHLLEAGRAATLRKHTPAANEIKIVSYNIRWRGGDELKHLAKLLHEDPEVGGASILCLQEVDRKKKRTGNSNTAKALADALGMHYAWTAPPTAKTGDEEETGVAIMSVYPLTEIKRIVLPNAGPNQRRRVALGATIEIDGRKWRVYSVHAETRIPLDKKMEQYNAVLEDLRSFPPDTPAIVMGDFNTWEPNAGGKTAKLFTNAGLTTPFGGQKTFRRRVWFLPIELHLDWVWLRGLEATRYGVDRQIDVSDHWPLWTIVRPVAVVTKK
ncbi:MAG TPA: endonuclease/exonuclease/phosphatase family protein [Pyrinomonadaceae bacterium]|jgi:endonuclease/exonuclease/phosphatase family metal-dependent hydrolase|nr:endonuclease/exonuclease/phosphatase family protein [Pyrinomonadaceae bacterium]